MVSVTRREGLALRVASLFVLVVWAAGCGVSQGGDNGESSAGEASVPPERTLSDARLVEELSDGGEVVFLRHAATNLAESDEDKSDLKDCSTQRNLTDEGRRQAREVGRAFDRLDLPLGKVLASPYCRTRQTAQLAFRGYETSGSLLSPEYVPEGEKQDFEDYEARLEELLSTPPEAGTNKVLVGHESVLRAVTGESVPEGGAVVFEPLGDGGYRALGGVSPDDWRGLSR